MQQTLESFLTTPFGHSEPKLSEYEHKYKALVQKKKIWMEACTEHNGSYFVHIKVGSDSHEGMSYDVVLLFYTDNPVIKKDVSFRRYYVKFFSNSPSFIYRYAMLYSLNDMIIDELEGKLDELHRNSPPMTANPHFECSYEKSLYSACRWMQDHRVSAFNKVGIMARRKKRIDQFFKDISTFEDIQLQGSLNKIGKALEKGADKSGKNVKFKGKHGTVRGSNTSSKPSITYATKTSGTMKKTKTTAKTSTTKKTSVTKKK